MKKIMTIALLAMFANATFAQSALELAKQQAELKAYQIGVGCQTFKRCQETG